MYPHNPPSTLQQLRWASARIIFILYVCLSVATVIGGFATAPMMSWYFFGDWRFWRYLGPGSRMLPHGLRILRLMFTQERGFMFAVPLTSPPVPVPDPAVALQRQDWEHGASCGTCSNCCKPMGIACPLLASDQGHCLGYNSFYWRYFNCGRFPSLAEEIDFYDCRKWALVAMPANPPRVTETNLPNVAGPLIHAPSGQARQRFPDVEIGSAENAAPGSNVTA